MNLKKIFAALLAVVMLLSCLPFAASAANEPSVLYVGEKDKTDDNLIPMLDAVGKSGNVRVYAIDRNTQAYYTLTYEKNVGYVLTFYNDYTMSELIGSRSTYCGLYCDGDLTVRIAGNVTFNADDEKYKGAIGWIVEGKLTIENALYDENGVALPAYTPAVLNVNGALAKTKNENISIGISAPTVMLNHVTVNAFGGYAGVVAEEALVMNASQLYANSVPEASDWQDPEPGAEPLQQEDEETDFAYSVVTANLIQVGGLIKATGAADISAFYFRGGKHIFSRRAVVYGKDYVFAEKSYNGLWNDSFTLFRDPYSIPSCMSVSVGSSVAKISGNKLTLNRRGSTAMALYIQCGRDSIWMDGRTVDCQLVWWQWIPYILSGAWIDALRDR